MANAQKALTKEDIKGDLLQRIECATCTQKLGMVESFDIVELDKAETREEGSRQAVTIMCGDCQKANKVPIRGYRFVGPDIIGEFQIEDLPDMAPAKSKTEE